MSEYVDKTGEIPQITPAGYEYLSRIVTDPIGDVYAFLPEASVKAAAAAMARLSRSPNDMRLIYLDEFAGNETRIDSLLERVVVQYGDDSVQQLYFLQLGVENASNLATKQLELGRIAAYLEQSTRYIFFDRKVKGKYKYLIPKNFTGPVRDRYTRDMDRIFDNYSAMVRGVTDFVRQRNPFVPDPEQNEAEQTAAKRAWTDATRAQACDAVRPVLPCSTQSTVGIVGTAQAIDNMIMRLASEEIQEFQELASNILKQVREVAPVFFVRTDLANRGGAKTEYRRQNRSRMQKIATRLGLRIPVRKTPVLEEDPSCVSLLSYTPSDETSLAADCLYDSALDSSHEEIQRAVRLLTHNERGDILRAYIGDRLNRRHKPGRAFEKAHYEWEILGDYGTFRDLQRHRMVDDMRWPELTPNYGFAVPQLVIEAGYQELFNECFGISYDLYWNLRFSDDPASAQYAVLLGHLMRYKFIANARESYHLHELRTTIQGHPGYRRIVFKMHEKIQEIHPIIGGGMIFVGQKDTPELIRLDSALAIERKLAML